VEINRSLNNVIVTGNIKSMNDFQDIKKTLDAMKSSGSEITLELKDSISITSSVIGYLNKLILKDGMNLSIKVGNTTLMELFDDLNLIKTLNVSKV
jgi:hypothetical protein